MARSTDPDFPAHGARGFVPARTENEKFLVRHIEDLARTAISRGIPKYSAFLSDREQELAKTALNRAGAQTEEYRFDGGWVNAERKMVCIEPEGCYPASPLACVRLVCKTPSGAPLPVHKDYLGSLMGLEIRRESLGDIVLPSDEQGVAYVFALETIARLICQELRQVGRCEMTAEPCDLESLPTFVLPEHEHQTVTVSSLRLDAVLAAILRCSRGMATDLVAAGRVEINHLPAMSGSALVYEGDVFTVRGKGRYSLTALPGKSRKDRFIIEFFQY